MADLLEGGLPSGRRRIASVFAATGKGVCHLVEDDGQAGFSPGSHCITGTYI